MVMNVLMDLFGSVCTVYQMMEAVSIGQIVCAKHLDCKVP